MDVKTIVAIALLLGTFLFFILIRLPITFAMISSAVISALYLGLPVVTIWQRIAQGVQSFSLLAIPFFILAGEIMLSGGIADRLVEFADIIVGRFRGGMAQVNIVASMFFGAVSGSATADISSIGATLIPLMERQGYDRDFSIHVTVTSSCQSMIIPPSHNMIMYCMAAGSVSAGRMFLGGILPGILLGACLMVVTGIISVKRQYPKGKAYSLREALVITRDSLLGLLTIVIILLGVCTGLFTATESAACACAYAFFLTFFIYRKIKISAMGGILLRTGKTLAMVLGIIAAANGFGYMLTYLRVPQMIVTWMTSVTNNKYLLLLMINILLLFLGCIMDVAPLIMITTPILLPIATSLQMDPVQFGIMLLLNLAVGACTPPVGLALFAGCAVGKRPIEQVVRGIWPFYLAMLLALLLVTYIPALSMTLPNIFMPL